MRLIFSAEKCNKHKVTSENLIQITAQITTNNYLLFCLLLHVAAPVGWMKYFTVYLLQGIWITLNNVTY